MIVLLLSLLLAPAESGWLKLFDEPDESTLLERSSVKRSGSDAIVWIRHDYRRARPGGVRSLRDQWHVSCAHRSFTMFALVAYDGRGRIVRAQPIPATERRAAPVIPGSRMERVFKAVCG